MNTTVDRIERAYRDVVAVEELAPGMVRVVTWADQYVIDSRGDGCGCPDKRHNLPEGVACKHEASAIIATRDDLPGPWDPAETLNARNGEARPVMADGGREYPDSFEVVDHSNGNHKPANSKSDAEDMAETAREFGSDNVEILDPADGMSDGRPEPDGGNAEVVEAQPKAEVVDADDIQRQAADLPERDVGTDPLTWMPGEFVDDIDGSQAINRKGFEVLAHFYDVGVESDLEVPPEDTEHEYCRVKATATIDGRTVESYGSAHVDRGDDATLLLEMADTRARKRALSIATGAGAVAVEELKNTPEDGR